VYTDVLLSDVASLITRRGWFELELFESGKRMDVKPSNFELVAVPVGLAVEVHGLVGAAEYNGLNGKKGVVESRVRVELGHIVALHYHSSTSY
jgi:hypothetical protein